MSIHYRHDIKIDTMVPLLRNAPEEQKEFVTRSKAVAVLVSRLYNAPQAV